MEEEQVKKKRRNNKTAGSNYEREKAKEQRGIGYEGLRTSRECSRKRDNQKVDLCNSDEDQYGRHPFNIQCKNTCKAVIYPKLLSEMEEHNGTKQLNVIFHKLTEKTTGAGKFMPKGEYAILRFSDFIRMQELLKANNLDKLLIQPK